MCEARERVAIKFLHVTHHVFRALEQNTQFSSLLTYEKTSKKIDDTTYQ